MTKSRLVFLIASSLVVVPLLFSGFARASSANGKEKDSLFKYLSVFTEVLSMVRQAYVEEPDLRVLMSGALDGAADALDPFSAYVPAKQAKNYLANKHASRELSGMVILKDRGVAWIVALDPGGPAQLAGLKQGDIISDLADVSTRSMPTWRIHQILAQEAGTRIKVATVRSSEDESFELVLDRERPTATAEIVDRDEFAYLRLKDLTAQTVEEVRTQLPKVGERTLLIDVRGLAGGDEAAAYSLAGLFATGKLGELVGRDGPLRTFTNDVATSFAGDVVVLQDRSTLGPAEIIGAVLKERDNVTLLGERGFGHAGQLGQERLSTGGLLEFTQAYYTGPDGEAIDEGIKPNVRVRRRFTAEEENADALYLKHAIETFRESLEKDADEAQAVAG